MDLLIVIRSFLYGLPDDLVSRILLFLYDYFTKRQLLNSKGKINYLVVSIHDDRVFFLLITDIFTNERVSAGAERNEIIPGAVCIRSPGRSFNADRRISQRITFVIRYPPGDLTCKRNYAKQRK